VFDKIKNKLTGEKTSKSSRTLEKIDQLLIGDMLEMSDSFGLPPNIRDQTFEVISIDSYYYDERLETEWTLQGGSKEPIFLSLDENSNNLTAVLSMQLKKKNVDYIMGWGALLAILNSDECSDIELINTDIFDGWLSERYYCDEFNEEASYLDGDQRHSTISHNNREVFQYFKFSAQNEKQFLEIERWSKNEIDVFISILRPVSDIKELWPKA